MNKRQKIKHLQKLNAKHIEARLELSKALNSAIEDNIELKRSVDLLIKENEVSDDIIFNLRENVEKIKNTSLEVVQSNITLKEENFDLAMENQHLTDELNKPLLSRLWRWKR